MDLSRTSLGRGALLYLQNADTVIVDKPCLIGSHSTEHSLPHLEYRNWSMPQDQLPPTRVQYINQNSSFPSPSIPPRPYHTLPVRFSTLALRPAQRHDSSLTPKRNLEAENLPNHTHRSCFYRHVDFLTILSRRPRLKKAVRGKRQKSTLMLCNTPRKTSLSRAPVLF